MKSYSEKLKHPKWQRKRLEVLSRDNFTCVKCGDSETELHVNHLKYKGEPHDVPLNYLETLCKNCHKIYHAMPDYKIVDITRLIDPTYEEIYCVQYINKRKKDVAFAHFPTENKLEFISDYSLMHRDNMNFALIYEHGISVNFLDSCLDFYDFGGIDKFAYEFYNDIKNPHFKSNKEVCINRTSHSSAIEIFGVHKRSGIYHLKYIGGGS